MFLNVNIAAELQITLVASENSVLDNDVFSFNLTATNNGPNDAIDVIVTYDIAEELVVLNNDCFVSPFTIALANAESYSCLIDVEVDHSSGKRVVSTATVTSTFNYEADTSDNRDAGEIWIKSIVLSLY